MFVYCWSSSRTRLKKINEIKNANPTSFAFIMQHMETVLSAPSAMLSAVAGERKALPFLARLTQEGPNATCINCGASPTSHGVAKLCIFVCKRLCACVVLLCALVHVYLCIVAYRIGSGAWTVSACAFVALAACACATAAHGLRGAWTR